MGKALIHSLNTTENKQTHITAWREFQFQWDMVLCSCKSRAQEVEAGESTVQGQPQLHTECETLFQKTETKFQLLGNFTKKPHFLEMPRKKFSFHTDMKIFYVLLVLKYEVLMK